MGIEASRAVDDTQVIEKIKRQNPHKLSKHAIEVHRGYTKRRFEDVQFLLLSSAILGMVIFLAV